MKITAYARLTPEEIIYDPESRTVSAKVDRQRVFHPTMLSDKNADRGEWYRFSADIPENSFFEALGANDQTEGRTGNYTIGHFDSFDSACRAADKAGVQGTRGEIKLFVYPSVVHSIYNNWERNYKRVDAIPVSGFVSLHSILTIDASDESAMLKSNPEYAAYLQLKAKFGE